MTLLRVIEDDSDFYPAANASGDRFFGTGLLAEIEAIAAEIDREDSFEAALQGVATAIARTSPWPMCGVELFDLEEQRPLGWVSAGYDPSATAVFEQWPAEGDTAVTAARRNQILTVPDVSNTEFPHTRRLAIRTGFRSAIYVPIRLTDCWAVLTLCRPDAHEFTSAELSQAGTIASLVTMVLRSARKAQLSDSPATAVGEIDVPDRYLREHAAAQDRLLQLQVGGASLSELCQTVSDLLDLPVVLLDRFRQPLGSARLSADEATDLCAWLSGEKAARDDGRGLVSVVEGSRRTVVGHCFDGSHRLGSLAAVVSSDGVPGVRVSQTLQLACAHVTLALLRQRAAIEAEVRMRQDFGEALTSMGASGLGLSQLAAVLGIGLDTPHRVMRVHPEGLRRPLSSHDAFGVAELLTKRLAQIGVDAVVSPVGGVDFVLVLREQAVGRGAVTPAQVVRAGLRDVLGALSETSSSGVAIAIGIGHAGVGVEALDRSHREAKRALEVARSMDGDESERHIAEVGSYAVLTATSAATAMDQEQFVRRYLEPLLEYDRVHNAGYVQTLQTYFECVGNVQRTADKLFLHLSTVRYRLKRIEELAEIDLREEEDRLCMQLALRLVRLPSSTRG